MVLLLLAFAGQAWAQRSPRFQLLNTSGYQMGYQVTYASDLLGQDGSSFSSQIKLLRVEGSTAVFRSIQDYDGHVSSVTVGLVQKAPNGGYLFSGQTATALVPAVANAIVKFDVSANNTASGVLPTTTFLVIYDSTPGQNPPAPLPLRRHRFILQNNGPATVDFTVIYTDGTLGYVTFPPGMTGLYNGQVGRVYAVPEGYGFNYATYAYGTGSTTAQVPLFEVTTEENVTYPGQPTGRAAVFTLPVPVIDDAYTPANASTGSN